MKITELIASMKGNERGEVAVTEPVDKVAEAVFAEFPAGSGVSFGIDGEVDPVRVTWWPAETAG
jgi:hypothetical protein